MPAFPAQCPKCKTVFPFHGIGVGEGVQAKIGIGSDVAITCPKCGNRHARISQGLYSANTTAVEIISAPQSTYAALEALKAIAEQATAGKISKTEAIERAKKLDPRYAWPFHLPAMNPLGV
jgi:predicted nucleic-acid-binding Zn-ribbon protein